MTQGHCNGTEWFEDEIFIIESYISRSLRTRYSTQSGVGSSYLTLHTGMNLGEIARFAYKNETRDFKLKLERVGIFVKEF